MHVTFPSWFSSLVGTARVDQVRHLEFVWWNHVCDELDENRRATDKSAVMRLANLSHDRPELAFATKEIARSMQTPDEASWMAWKRTDRFCMGTPRVVWRSEKQAPLSYLDADGQ